MPPDAVYIGSWGPEYHGSGKIKLWFDEWNTRGTVQRWDIRQYFHKGDQTVVEWSFRCAMTDGVIRALAVSPSFVGMEQDRSAFCRNSAATKIVMTPYAQGKTPVFREEQALWF